MNLKKTIQAFHDNEFAKPEYIERMHMLHGSLFDYAEYLSGTDVEKIEISDQRVLMTMRGSGIKFICDRMEKRTASIEALNFRNYEKPETDMVLALMEKGGGFFDIGANVGWYSLVVAKLIENTHVFAFEPIPRTFAALKEHIAINEVSNVKIYNFGFSDRDAKMTFFISEKGSDNASAADLSNDGDSKRVVCQVKKLDDFVRKTRSSVDFIKCDVEGAELFVYRGGVRTIREQKPVVFSEMLRKWSSKFSYHPNEIIDLFSAEGYRCFTIGADRLVEFHKMDESTAETNFFFLHAEKHADKIRKFAAD